MKSEDREIRRKIRRSKIRSKIRRSKLRKGK
jgi:hypothetical protein